MEMFWQSDGPQPHVLNIHFFKVVAIAHMRVNIDYQLDESYTPTRICFLAGTGHHDLTPVCDMRLDQPKGWLDVDLSNVGGEPDDGEDMEYEDEAIPQGDPTRPSIGRNTLRCMLVQVRVAENHQNGKDTHLRGLQIFARDPTAKRPARRKLPHRPVEVQNGDPGPVPKKQRKSGMFDDFGSIPGLQDPDWMGEPELR